METRSLFFAVGLLALVAGCQGNTAKPIDMSVDCQPGALGCSCDPAGKCASGAFCSNQRVCVEPTDGCEPGTLDCQCAGGGCNSGLRCVDGVVCRDGTGFAGGACLENLRCHTGHRCAAGTCVPCGSGQQGCTCTDDGKCNETLTCKDSMCVSDTGWSNNGASGQCVTPCSAGLTLPDGTYRDCPSDGLMPGCLPGFECAQGQCKAASQTPASCTADVDCPDFQTCLSGLCRPNCESTDDCKSGAICYRHVCHKACNLSQSDCPDGLICQPFDGQSGVCIMRADGPGDAPSGPVAELKISATQVRFSSHQTKGSFDLQNASDFGTRVVIRKLRHREPDPLTKEPLSISLIDRETPPRVVASSCTIGTRGCRCAEDSARRCTTLHGVDLLPQGMQEGGLALTCEENLCQLPTCTSGTHGCVCNGEDCRLLCQAGRCPLAWIGIDVKIDANTVVSGSSDMVLGFEIPAGKTASVSLDSPKQDFVWDGELEIEVSGSAAHRPKVSLIYTNNAEGRWAGEAYYFGDFPVNQAGLATWLLQRGTNDVNTLTNIHNALIRRWADFRRGANDFGILNEMLTSFRTESWRSAELMRQCREQGGQRTCYPSQDPMGYGVLSNIESDEPVPAGVVEMPFAMTLSASKSEAASYEGAIDSSTALQYPGGPRVSLRFVSDPASCVPGNDGNCVSFLDSFSMVSVVGGRYPLPASGECTPKTQYRAVKQPWLVPGFVGASQLDLANGRRYVHTCRETGAPFADGVEGPGRNVDLAAANPLLDGKARQRTVTLIDGALVNGEVMVLLFREETPALVPMAPPSVAYGFIILGRQDTNAELPAAPAATMPANPPGGVAPRVACAASRDLLKKIADRTQEPDSVDELLDGKHWPLVARALVTGKIADDDVDLNNVMKAPGWEYAGEQVHYLCEDTRRFDSHEECPVGSRVTYFTVDPSNGSLVSSHQCNELVFDPKNTGDNHLPTCDKTLRDWLARGTQVVKQLNPAWRCADDAPTCDQDRVDLRKGKIFYPESSNLVFMPLATAVDEAFRYRTRFQNRDGTGLGFAPDICDPNQLALPYCYSPEAIAELEQRYDCLLDIYVKHYDAIAGNQNVEGKFLHLLVAQALKDGFSYRKEGVAPNFILRPGFEKLRAELLVMLGDDAYTKSLSSRFDLAGLNNAAFEGTLLEEGGINLSGVAGAEMQNLYRATQYYQMATERFGKLLEPMWSIIASANNSSDEEPIVGQAAVVEYLGRVIRASSQRARVSAEIGKRYQLIDRPDLSRRVIERAYVGGYLDSMVLSTLMSAIKDDATGADVPQIRDAIQKAQLTYRVGLADMAEQYKGIVDQVNFFGLSPDYIPFPAMEAYTGRDNAPEVALFRAQQRRDLAERAEEFALTTTRSFESDSVAFQNELTRISNTYEAQLSEICGTFVAGGVVYPAINRYAHLDTVASRWGDPCGRMGNGQIWDAVLALQGEGVELQRVVEQMKNLQEEANIEKRRIEAACGVQDAWEQALIREGNAQVKVSNTIRRYQGAIAATERSASGAVQIATTSLQDVSGGYVTAGIALTLGAANWTSTTLDALTKEEEKELQKLQNKEKVLHFEYQCNDHPVLDENGKPMLDESGNPVTGNGQLQIDSRARVETLLVHMSEFQLGALREQLQVAQAQSRLGQLTNQARRIAAEMEESFQLTINLEAARNNPNYRIYRNDAIIQADRMFQFALREAYRATRVFEYATGQSYADKQKLFLARMVARGDYNLTEYLTELEDAWRAFEDVNGTADLRVKVLSLRDDLLKIPYLRESGEPISTNDRTKMMHARLADPASLDPKGHVVVPFSIGPADVSPFTRLHKLRFIEAQIVGGNGDQLGTVYVRSAGTSLMTTLDDQLQFYNFPVRLGINNVFFSVKPPEYDPQIFRITRFADRPLMNTRWEMVLNMKDEPENRDFALTDINDIRLFFYYADFTK